jgi:uridine kinase
MNKCLVIGLTGGSGSGKTYFLQKLFELFTEDEISLFSMDNYYFPIEAQEKDANGVENFDRPQSLDIARFCEDLIKLKSGQDLRITEYNFNHRDLTPKKITIRSTPAIVVEGLFALHEINVRNELDLKLYVDTPEYLMLKRRIIRDASERGYDLSDVLYRFESHVIPAFKKYILPYKYDADIIIPNHVDFNKTVDVISSYIKQFLAE